ncbi:MAG: hypothetical protein M1840_008203 [Geoglossum simile]|nr:MAG: hypothetical protein M1840_008203 [Geoglossum simile]
MDINYLRVAQTLGITSSAFLAGSIFTTSFISIPSLLLAPAPLLQQQWEAQYLRGRVYGPSVTLFSTANLLIVAYKRYDSGGFGEGEGSWQAYVAAASLSLLIFPYTAVLLRGVNQKLVAAGRRLEKKADTADAGDEGVKMLVDRWATFNFFRAFIPLSSALVSIWAALG